VSVKLGGDTMETRYLCENWQGLLQMIVYLTSRGYYYYCLTLLPINKKDKWPTIDQKLICRYQTSKSKFQRARAKLKKHANFYYLRWGNVAIILHTEGKIEGIEYADKFDDIRIRQMVLPISELITFTVSTLPNKGRKVCVRLSRETYRGFKAVLADVASTKNIAQMKSEFQKINGLPAYSSVIEQKRNLARYLVKKAQRHQIALKASALRVSTKLVRYKVFQTE
jgi:hypothetical protein